MQHNALPRVEALYEERVSAADNGRKGDKPGARDALNVWLWRGATNRQAVELVYASALEGNPLT